MELLHVASLEKAREMLMDRSRDFVLKTERISVRDACGRVLAAAVRSGEDVPSFSRSTVDGYAVFAEDTHGATESIPAFLNVVEEIVMGKSPEKKIARGQCSYVPTGGMLPDGANAVVMVEQTELLDEATTAVYGTVAPGQNVIRKGEDVKKDAILLERGSRLSAPQLGVLAGAGVEQVEVFCPVRAVIFSTGDELIPPGQSVLPGQVYDINSYTLMAAGMEMGMEIVKVRSLPDRYDEIRAAVKDAMGRADIVLTSGGSSKGKKDMTSKIFEELASPGVFVHGLAVRPGKPTILATDDETGTILAGLPGHPSAALMIMEQTIGWYLRERMGIAEPVPVYAAITTNLANMPGRTSFQPVELFRENGALYARPILGKSGLISPMCRADGYIILERANEGVAKGEQVAVYRFAART